MRKLILCVLIVFGILLFQSAYASEDDIREEINDLRKQIEEMSAYYDSKIADMEARFHQYAGEIPAEEHDHGDSHPHDFHGHIHEHSFLGMDKIKAHGELDLRYLDIEESKSMLFVHEATVGVEAELSDWMFALVEFSHHYGESMELHRGFAILKFDELDLKTKVGKFRVNFGPENRVCFFGRRTITSSAMRDGIFGPHGWYDVGAQFDWLLPFDFHSDLSFSVLNGDNAKSFGDGSSEVSNNNKPIAANWTNSFDTKIGYFKLGSSFAYGLWDRDDEYHTFLVGGDGYYKIGNLDFQAELIYRAKKQPGVDNQGSYGYYVLGAYTIPMNFKYLENIELLFSFGQFIPNTGIRETRYSPQLTFNLNDYDKLRAMYEIREEYPKDFKDNRFISQFAYEF